MYIEQHLEAGLRPPINKSNWVVVTFPSYFPPLLFFFFRNTSNAET